MNPFLSLAYIVAVKVFKKTTPNGKVTVYLGKRDFIDHTDHCEPIDGVVVVENDYLQGRKVYGQVSTTYRYGREEDEVMGLKFSKELVLANEQIVPQAKEKKQLTPVQEKLVRKFGANAYPFTFQFPPNSPSSVTLQPSEEDQGKPLGVEYAVKTFVTDGSDERGHKRSTVTLAIKKLQYAPLTPNLRQPSSLVCKGFTFSQGKINMEVTLDKEIYYHGEKIGVNLSISNNSRKSVKNIKIDAVQHCEVTMINSQFSRHVAGLETREGCPITPGASFNKVIYLIPLASSNTNRWGIALDGYFKDDDVNLASSTLVADGKCPIEAIGIVISYSIRVKLNCGALGGELVTDVPFKLLHPAPGSADSQTKAALKKTRSIERTRYENSSYADDDDNIVFEDFARLRLNEAEN